MIHYIKQGDEYSLPVALNLNGRALYGSGVEKAEFRIGPIRKLYPDDVGFDAGSECFLVPLGQRDTMKLVPDSSVPLDIRVKLVGGGVLGLSEKIYFDVIGSLSREVI